MLTDNPLWNQTMILLGEITLIIVVFLIFEPRGLSEIFSRIAKRLSRSGRKEVVGSSSAVSGAG